MRTRSKGLRRAGLFAGIVVLVTVVAPLYWAALMSARGNADVYQAPPNFLPVGIDLTGILEVLRSTPILDWLMNSLIVAVPSTLIAMLLGVPAGYALSRFTSRSTKAYSGGILVTQMMPPIVMLVPIFLVFREVKLIDGLLGLILADISIILPLVIWMSTAMIGQIPRDLDEAAMVDGCTHWQAFRLVTLPILKPALAGISVYAFIEVWDEFLFARTLISTQELWPASVGLYSFQGADFVPINQVMFVALVFTAVPLILFLAVRRSLVASMTAGAVKG